MSGQQGVRQRTYDRKGFIAVSALTAFLAACGGDHKEAGGTTSTTEQKLGGTLLYYNWADYVNPKTYLVLAKAA